MSRPMLVVQCFDIVLDGGRMLDVAPDGWREAWVLCQWLGQGLGIAPDGGAMLISCLIAGARLGCCPNGGATLILRSMVAQCLGIMPKWLVQGLSIAPNGWRKA